MVENLPPQPEPQPDPQPEPVSTAEPLPPNYIDDSVMGFEPLGKEKEDSSFSDLPPEPNPVIPFTGAELVQAVTWMLVFGLRLQTPEEVQAFTEAFQMGIVPMLPPAQVLDMLKVGEALAQYGIGRNRFPGIGGLTQLPPWLRILLGGAVMALSAYGGIRAVQTIRNPSAPFGFGSVGSTSEKAKSYGEPAQA
jgi:hypothetical protein